MRFRAVIEERKRSLPGIDFTWYPYDSFANVFYIQQLLRDVDLRLEELVGEQPVLDIGAADGVFSFFLESPGYRVSAWDSAGTNINAMKGIRTLAAALDSRVEITDVNLDGRFDVTGAFGLVFFLGTLYHLKNPFYALERLAAHARFCFLSTRIARVSADGNVRPDKIPVAWLLDEKECNSDATNYWVFSPAGLELLVKRAGWQVLGVATSGARDSNPVTHDADERMFLLLRSKHEV